MLPLLAVHIVCSFLLYSYFRYIIFVNAFNFGGSQTTLSNQLLQRTMKWKKNPAVLSFPCLFWGYKPNQGISGGSSTLHGIYSLSNMDPFLSRSTDSRGMHENVNMVNSLYNTLDHMYMLMPAHFCICIEIRFKKKQKKPNNTISESGLFWISQAVSLIWSWSTYHDILCTPQSQDSKANSILWKDSPLLFSGKFFN